MTNSVKIYSLSTCTHCKGAMDYLDDLGIKYDHVHVDLLTGQERTDMINEVRSYNPSVSFPTILVNGYVLCGFDKFKMDEALQGDQFHDSRQETVEWMG